MSVLPACGVETVIHDVGEKEANEIVVLLADHEINSVKQVKDTGRQILYSIAVKPAQRVPALKILNENDYPRRTPDGYDSVYKESGLIPTSSEEKAKRLRAIEGEIERQLTLVAGVLDAQVNLVIPEESALRTNEEVRTPTTASVTVKYLPGQGGTKPLSEPEIRAIVAAGVEKLSPDHVVVVMTEARPPVAVAAACPEGGGKLLGKLSERSQKLMIAGVGILIIILGLGLVFGQIRLRNVRGRLIRLQNEIAKARRKPEPALTE